MPNNYFVDNWTFRLRCSYYFILVAFRFIQCDYRYQHLILESMTQHSFNREGMQDEEVAWLGVRRTCLVLCVLTLSLLISELQIR